MEKTILATGVVYEKRWIALALLCAAQFMVIMDKVTEGNVYMQTNNSLANEEIRSGYVLLCQSHPLDGEVTIEIG